MATGTDEPRILHLMTARPLRVLLLAEDRRLLRHLSRFLNTFGYKMQQSADDGQALMLIDAESVDVAIVDSDVASGTALEFCRQAGGRPRSSFVFIFLMARKFDPELLTEALEAGVDDFLSKPVVYGELLVRLRVAARELEFERRAARQSGIEPVTGLPTRTGLCQLLRRDAVASPRGLGPTACVLLDLDHLAEINTLHGRLAGDEILRSVAATLVDRCPENGRLAAVGPGRFCAWLPGTSASNAVAWAERVRDLLAETETVPGHTPLRLLTSGGLVVDDSVSDPEETIRRAEEALQLAKQSGRNCVVRHGEHRGETKEWTDLAAPGRLFEQTTARDVMVPCPTTLRADELMSRARAVFRQTRCQFLPVVDAKGKLAGVLSAEDQRTTGRNSGRSRVKVVDSMTVTDGFEEDTPFAALLEHFTRGLGEVIVVVSAGRPTGIITADNLANLSAPLTTETFAASAPFAVTSDYLMVPDV